jgi:quercetin dioxygenase-like cupin family protein
MLGLLSCWVLGQIPVPVSQEPDHHLKFENDSIRVYDVVVPPGASTLFHVHSLDYFFVNFEDADLKSQTPGQSEQDLILGKGEVRYSPAPLTHRVRNVGTNAFHNLTVELLRPPAARSTPAPALGTHQTLVLDNARMRAVQTLLQPGESTGIHSHPQHTLIVVVENGAIEGLIPVGGKPNDSGRDGWHDAALTHDLKNTGRAAVLVIEVEVK